MMPMSIKHQSAVRLGEHCNTKSRLIFSQERQRELWMQVDKKLWVMVSSSPAVGISEVRGVFSGGHWSGHLLLHRESFLHGTLNTCFGYQREEMWAQRGSRRTLPHMGAYSSSSLLNHRTRTTTMAIQLIVTQVFFFFFFFAIKLCLL